MQSKNSKSDAVLMQSDAVRYSLMQSDAVNRITGITVLPATHTFYTRQVRARPGTSDGQNQIAIRFKSRFDTLCDSI